jgi:hypothetical protein
MTKWRNPQPAMTNDDAAGRPKSHPNRQSLPELSHFDCASCMQHQPYCEFFQIQRPIKRCEKRSRKNIV